MNEKQHARGPGPALMSMTSANSIIDLTHPSKQIIGEVSDEEQRPR